MWQIEYDVVRMVRRRCGQIAERRTIPTLHIGDLETRIPIVQGGMGVGISLSNLAAAVANEGGIGVIATAGIGMSEPDFDRDMKKANQIALRKEIRNARGLSDGIIGVNIMVALSDFDDLVAAAIEERADIVFVGAGLLLKDPRVVFGGKHSTKTKIAPIVSSAKATRIIFESWKRKHGYLPDAVVVEGPMAGGHLGFKPEQITNPAYNLDRIVTDVITLVESYTKGSGKHIPVIAAGGVYTGADIYRLMRLGADAVQMGTRFVATYECDASDAFKQAYLNCKKEDLIIIKSPVGLPGRAIRNGFLENVNAGEKKPVYCPYKCLRTCDFRKVPYCIALALLNAKRGALDAGFAFAGANAYRVDRILHVRELIETLVLEYQLCS